jgi:hypothetical protein
MPNQIIVVSSSISNSMLNLNLVFWYVITSGIKTTTGVSAWPNASTAENAAIQAGTILEEQNAFSFPMGLSAANIEAFLNQFWTNRNTAIGGVGPGNLANFGFNGTAWVANIT